MSRQPRATKPRHTPATKWRHAVAMSVSPWNRVQYQTKSPEGTIGTSKDATPVAPLGLCDRVRSRIHGFAPVATPCRPFGTDPGRCIGAEELEDGGVPFAEKMEGLSRELATPFHESEKLQTTIRDNTQKLGFALPEVGE